MENSSDTTSTPESMRAVVVFSCLDPDCQQSISFNVMDLRASKGRISCQACHRPYHFDTAFLDKLERLRNLIFAVQAAEDILADSSVAVTTPMGEVKVPYSLLLTRLNTTITLTVGEHRVDFCFRVEPLNDGSFT